jgi:hypothetical protein
VKEVRVSINPLGSGTDMHGSAIAAMLLQRLGGSTVITVEEFEWFKNNFDKMLVINEVDDGRVVTLEEDRHGSSRKSGDTGV